MKPLPDCGVLWVLALSALIIGLCSSCVTTSDPEILAYRTIGTVAHTVDATMNGWGDWVRGGKATAGDQAKVKTAYQSFQSAMVATESAVVAYRNGTNKNMLEASIEVLQAAANAVMTMVSTTKGIR